MTRLLDLAASPRSALPGAPWLLRIARTLDRRRWRGGTALQQLMDRVGLLRGVAHYELGRGIGVEVPLRMRPLDAVDVRTYEAALVERLAEAIAPLPPPVTLVDCGADFGLLSLLLVARCRAIGRVLAVEPNGDVFPTLAANLARLPVPARAVHAAVADAEGRGVLCRPDHDPASDVARFIAPRDDGSIAITTVDRLAADVHGSVLLKCDVEGGELAVVRGARETLRRAARFVVVFEAHPDHVARTGIDPVEVLREVEAIRPCRVHVAECDVGGVDASRPLFEQLGVRRIVNLVCTSV
jgi:FkbM family methyltransferase